MAQPGAAPGPRPPPDPLWAALSALLDRERLVDAMVDDYDTADQIHGVRAHVRHLLDAALPVVVDRVELDELPPRSVLFTAHLQVVQTVRSCGGHRLVVGLDGTAPEISGAAFPMTVLAPAMSTADELDAERGGPGTNLTSDPPAGLQKQQEKRGSPA